MFRTLCILAFACLCGASAAEQIDIREIQDLLETAVSNEQLILTSYAAAVSGMNNSASIQFYELEQVSEAAAKCGAPILQEIVQETEVAFRSFLTESMKKNDGYYDALRSHRMSPQELEILKKSVEAESGEINDALSATAKTLQKRFEKYGAAIEKCKQQ